MAPLPPRYSKDEGSPFLDEKIKSETILIEVPSRTSIDSITDSEDEEFFTSSIRRSNPLKRILSFLSLVLLFKLYIFTFGFHLPSLPTDFNPFNRGGPCPHKLERLNQIEQADNLIDYFRDQNSIQWNGEEVGHQEEGIMRATNPWKELNRKVQQAFLQVPTAESAKEALRRYTSK